MSNEKAQRVVCTLKKIAAGNVQANHIGQLLRDCFRLGVLDKETIATQLGVAPQHVITAANGLKEKQVRDFCARLDLK